MILAETCGKYTPSRTRAYDDVVELSAGHRARNGGRAADEPRRQAAASAASVAG